MRWFARLAFLALLFTSLRALSTAALQASEPGSITAHATWGDKAVFPPGYPTFLKEVYLQYRHSERVTGKRPSTGNLIQTTKASLEEADFHEFLSRFGLDAENLEEIELEVMSQILRLQRREAYNSFLKRFGEAEPKGRIELVKESTDPKELEYALRQCDQEQFGALIQQVLDKDGFGPQTSQDKALLDYLQEEIRLAIAGGNMMEADQWRAVVAQLVSQPLGQLPRRLPFTKTELFAMLRNTERTLEQRKRPFVDISSTIGLRGHPSLLAREAVALVSENDVAGPAADLLAYAFFDERLTADLRQLQQVYTDILANHESGQTEATKESVRSKKRLIGLLANSPSKQSDRGDSALQGKFRLLVERVLKEKDQLHRLPFIRGIVLLHTADKELACRLIEDFPMIVAGDTYPYQWKHDNEVNIALLLANTDPYQAAQAIRFIIYHSMWRSEEAKRIGLYGWLPQITFGDRQTGSLPEFKGKNYYYFPDFPFRPTKEIDAGNERNRTSEIMQLPFFGWTVWRVYEELQRVHPSHAMSFLKEVYPYVRANTEAIRTALDPYSEAVLSGRDPWVNGMDNAWYHLMVMRRHLPERLIPDWAKGTVSKNRVDNRVGKCPGCPVDPDLVRGRPSDYYYQFKVVFYDIAAALGLDPAAVYHASPYNTKDAAITGVMARSLQAQIDMARILRNTDADVRSMSALRGQSDELVEDWEEEVSRYTAYLDRMKEAMNKHLWSSAGTMYYNRDVTHMFPGAANLFFCRPVVHDHEDIGCEPRPQYWKCRKVLEGLQECSLSRESYGPVGLNAQSARISLDADGHVQYQYDSPPQYWTQVDGGDGHSDYRLRQTLGDPFLVEQFSHLRKGQSGDLWYEPNPDYWKCGESTDGGCQLNQRAQNLIGRGARQIKDGDLVRSPGIAGFFPLFGQIPTVEQAAQLAQQVVNPWMWWPVDGIPIPTQPMTKRGPDGEYIPNEVYDSDRYWLGPTWMASTKPVMDGFKAYGYEMIYLYLVSRTAQTLQDGRAVEHWNAETGAVNTSNINFPWTASGIAGSIWPELSTEERAEYLRRFHPPRYVERRAQHYEAE